MTTRVQKEIAIICLTFSEWTLDKPRMSSTEGGGKDGKGEENRAVAVQQDPKNVAELTNYIQNMLQQMQDRWVRGFYFFSG